MKSRLAWLADPEYADSYSARETRVLLRAIARQGDIVPLWFAVGSAEPPHHWDGIRVFPVPPESLESPDFLRTLIAQQRPHLLLWDIPRSAFPAGFDYLGQNGANWIHRVSPDDVSTGAAFLAPLVLCGAGPAQPRSDQLCALPYLRGLDPAVRDGADPSTVLELVQEAIADRLSSGASAAPESRAGAMPGPCHVVMRQPLFSNSSVAHVMFELTNALIEIGVPTVPQDEQAMLSRSYIHREEDLFRAGAPEKYRGSPGASTGPTIPKPRSPCISPCSRPARGARASGPSRP